ncbi:MAG: ABC transporter permease subunit, partial [Thermoplasmata archaeon]|nr:ABC transporter permease subunit [Thermoplasmata archaeon]
TILWRHTHRRTLPVVVLVFGLTLPAYIGTQALVEAMFSDNGLGTLLLAEVANLRGEPPGFTGPTTGNFYQVLVFLLAILLLVSTLCADILARYLDPRLHGGET